MRFKKVLLPAAGAAVFLGLTWYLSAAISPEKLRDVLVELGSWAPAAYIALWVILPAFFFPVAVLALAGGILFGLWKGSVYTFVGALLNCALMFLIARRLGRRQVEALMRRKLSPAWQARLQQADGRGGVMLLILLRLIPAVPYNLINYAFGLSPMSFGRYLAASAAGIVPGTLAFINVGSSVLAPDSPDFWIALGLLGLLLVTTMLLGKKLWKKQKGEMK